jgi:hypothetical protein
VTDSWWLKLDRAAEHLREFEDLVSPLLNRGKYPVRKQWETYNHQPTYTYRLVLPDLPETIPVIAGDVMFNVRSALDHLAVAFAPANRKTKAAFPIFTCDVHTIDELTGDYLHKRDFKAWRKAISGMPGPVVDYIESIQPWHFIEEGKDPRDHILALLAQFQNADKHRQLAIVGYGLVDPIYWWTHPGGLVTRWEPPADSLPPDRVIANNAVVHWETVNPPPQMNLDMEGTPRILIGELQIGPFRHVPGVIGSMVVNGEKWATELARLVAP